jgi:hypothetical protein
MKVRLVARRNLKLRALDLGEAPIEKIGANRFPDAAACEKQGPAVGMDPGRPER